VIRHRFKLELFCDENLTPLERYSFDRAVADAIGKAIQELKKEEDFSGGSHVDVEHLLED
jgi:hypothetical protein